jgi:hypothetical protein
MRRAPIALCLMLAAFGHLAACDRNTEAFAPGEEPRPPDLARIFPESDPSAVRPGGAAPPMPAASPRGNLEPAPAPAPAQLAQAQPTAGDTISGTIRLDPALEGSVPPGALLFVIARGAGVAAGPPMAVLRVPDPQFPMSFEIGPGNVMVPGMRFSGDIDLLARVDGDGNAMTKLPGDLSGQTREPHRPGATGVSIVLDQKL